MSVAGYQYRINGGTPVDVGNELTAVISSLTSNTLYAIEVRAYDVSGNFSTWSSLSHSTPPYMLEGFSTSNMRAFDFKKSVPDYSGPAARLTISGVDTDVSFEELRTHAETEVPIVYIYSQDGSGDFLEVASGTPMLVVDSYNDAIGISGGVMGIPAFTDWNGKSQVELVIACKVVNPVVGHLIVGGSGSHALYGGETYYGIYDNTGSGIFNMFDSTWERKAGMLYRAKFDGTQSP
jgi:hypothetical protein